MNLQNNYLNKFRISKDSKEKILSDEIYDYFNGELNYGLIRKSINEIGSVAVNDIFRAIVKIDGYNREGMFINKVAEQKKNIKFN